MLKFINPYSLSVVASLFITSTTFAAATLQSTTLSNGLKVIIKEDHRAPLVMVQVWYAIGGADEPKEKLGISHLLEHMMFKGTIRVPDNELKRLNATYGGSLNAITNPNYTYYYQLFPKDYLGLALELEADRMSGLYLKQRDFMTEIQVVMEERRQRIDDNPQALAFEKFRYIAYPNSNYQQPVIGHMTNLKTIDLKDLQTWYDRWYAPNNATLVIVGDINSQQTLTQVQRYFGDISAKTLLPRQPLQQPTHIGHRHIDIDSNTQVANLYMAWNVPSLVTTPDVTEAYALSLLQNILYGQISSRLNRILMREQKTLAAVNVSYDMIQRGDTLFTITAIPQQKVSLKQAQQAIRSVITDLQKNPLSTDELEGVRTTVLANAIYNEDTLNGQAILLGSLEANGLSHALSNQFAEYYQRITPSDIQKVAQKYLTQNNLTTLYMQSEQHKALDAIADTMPETDNETPPTVPIPPLTQEQ